MLRSIRTHLKSWRRNLLINVPKLGYANLTAMWWRDRTWMAPYHQYLRADGRAGTRALARRFTLIQLANSVATLRGCTAECGVARGTGSALICETLGSHYTADELHFAFDSFEGVSEPTCEDRTVEGKCNWYKGKLSNEFQVVQRRLSTFPNCRVEKGWIPDCFAKVHRGQKFRFIHIDVDLYDPTRASLEFFYDRLVPGGIVLFDDHGFRNCPGAHKAATEFFHDKPESIVEMTTCQAFIVKAA